ncbi:exosortase H-associated membrane protein [Gilvimarinus chinensis]|uniref:exosortase H-associated membrane protein n=1 Tax=Gilvimarinus chinensis TaxID=396005 RepID=UPI0003716CDD|nr:exosortase H-associated membrane protein [Gilvimarinus chinensis]
MSQSKTWPLGERYFVKVLVCLPFFFLVWYFLAPYLSIFPVLIAKVAANWIWTDLILKVESVSHEVEYVTSIRVPGASAEAKGNLTVALNPLIYSWSLPLFYSLYFAVNEEYFRQKYLMICTLLMLGAHTFSVFFEFTLNLFVRYEEYLPKTLLLKTWQENIVALCYQFSCLMLPAISVLMLFFWCYKKQLSIWLERQI